jgi:hypothetical protein
MTHKRASNDKVCGSVAITIHFTWRLNTNSANDTGMFWQPYNYVMVHNDTNRVVTMLYVRFCSL